MTVYREIVTNLFVWHEQSATKNPIPNIPHLGDIVLKPPLTSNLVLNLHTSRLLISLN